MHRERAVTCAGVLLTVVAVLAAATTAGLHLYNGATAETGWWYGNVELSLAILIPGSLIVRRRPDNPIGWLMCAAGATEALCGAGREYLVFGFDGHQAPGWLWIGWFCNGLFLVATAALPTVLMLFPDGKPAERRWRIAARIPIAAALLGTAGYLLDGEIGVVRGHHIGNPVPGVPHALRLAPTAIGQSVLMVMMVVAVARVITRYRRSAGVERAQMKWLAWAGSITGVELLTELTPLNPIAPVTGSVTTFIFAAAVAIAILRHRLFDIDVVIARTVLFVTLSVAVVAAYLVIVAGFGALLGQPRVGGVPLAATAVIAVGFAPLRNRVQRRVDRWIFGARSDPYRVMTILSRQLEHAGPGGDLELMLATLATTVKAGYVGLVDQTGGVVAEVGVAPARPLVQPLVYGSTAMGELWLGAATGEDQLDGRVRSLVADLSALFAVVVHALTLSGDLQRSRYRLVSAKEEERRRLRRDLHDGVGPRLAALGLRLDAARLLVQRRPEEAVAMIDAVKDGIRGTLEEIRDLVYGLRPPTLDQLGLVGALRERALELNATGADGASFEVIGPDHHGFPAAVEVAAYWIATEAMTNVVRHAGARHCTVRLEVGDRLELTVRDDGAGLGADWRPGVGTGSMAERAAELGGSCTVTAAHPRGTIVTARLPLDDEAVAA